MKLALISTPRSGNTWLRYMVAGLYHLQQYAVHTPSAIDWGKLPPRSIVQLHWHYSPEFAGFLAGHGFQVLTISRHPLDVLLSVLQFAPNEPQTAMWLSGDGGDESSIYHRDVESSEFLAYATGPRARALLSVTPAWWSVPEVIRVRYEDLVSNPEEGLQALVERFGPVRSPFDEVLEPLSIDKLRKKSTNNHFWKGQPGHWRELMSENTARVIEDAHGDFFNCLDYSTSTSIR